jgi:hypothetical protein
MGGNMKKLRVGDWVEIRSKEEILKTLDKNGRLEELPFMPQMFQYCGKRFQVYKSAHKTCDWVYTVRSRRLPDGIHLNLRCNGEAYGGCQTACLIYWKKAWLKPVDNHNEQVVDKVRQTNVISTSGIPITNSVSCTEEGVWKGTKKDDQERSYNPVYSCQGTQVPEFTTPLGVLDLRQYLEDYISGNFTLFSLIRGFYNSIANRPRLGRQLRWMYDRYQAIKGGIPYPTKQGTVLPGTRTPSSILNLQPGELVRVKSYSAILATLDSKNENRGLSFDAEMAPYCEGTYRVRNRLNTFIDEKTGKLVTMKKEAIILEDVICRSLFSQCRIGCPRSIYPWWHEVWLERVQGAK